MLHSLQVRATELGSLSNEHEIAPTKKLDKKSSVPIEFYQEWICKSVFLILQEDAFIQLIIFTDGDTIDSQIKFNKLTKSQD